MSITFLFPEHICILHSLLFIASDKPRKALDRLEQLKKWKEERERKRKEEDNKHKPAFRVSKALDRKSETKLFEASKLKVGTVRY